MEWALGRADYRPSTAIKWDALRHAPTKARKAAASASKAAIDFSKEQDTPWEWVKVGDRIAPWPGIVHMKARKPATPSADRRDVNP